MKPYAPRQGDIVWIDLAPQAGRETCKRRPALIVTGNTALRRISGLAMVCPISSTDNGFPLHVPLTGGKTTGFVLCEQAKTLDLAARNAVFIERASDAVIAEVRDILKAMLD